MQNRWGSLLRRDTRGRRWSPGTLLFLACGVSIACGKETSPPAAPPPPPPPPPPAEHTPPPVEEPKSAEDLGVRILTEGFKTPESVIHDTSEDLYLVSNVNGKPHEKDDNGFIARVTPNGEVDPSFISGESQDVTLHAPKGMAVADGVLYVTDIDRVQTFDAVTGEPKQEILFRGATFLNDIAVSDDGEIWVSDSGLDENFQSTGTDAVYRLKDGKPVKVRSGKDLGGPNGLLPEEGGTWVVTFRSGELYWVGPDGKKDRTQKLPKGQNDGIVKDTGGRLLISSWEGASILAGVPGGTFAELVSGVKAPADIGYDAQRSRLLIPLFEKNHVIFHALEPQEKPITTSEAAGSPTDPAVVPEGSGAKSGKAAGGR